MTRPSKAEIIAFHEANHTRMTYPQMAHAMGITVGTFSGVIFRSRKPGARRRAGDHQQVTKIRLQPRERARA